MLSARDESIMPTELPQFEAFATSHIRLFLLGAPMAWLSQIGVRMARAGSKLALTEIDGLLCQAESELSMY